MKKIAYLFTIISSISLSIGNRDFASLQRYILGLSEVVPSDSPDWAFPDYQDFYHNSKPTWKDEALALFHLKKENPWDVINIKELLKNMVSNRKQFVEKGAYVLHITAKPDNKMIIWGDIFGAVHSLFRDLEHFHREGILDDQLKIVNPNYYFVFLGNIIDRSPYSLETLHIILVLMERNPNQVFYIKGKHERNNYWYNFNLQKQVATFIDQGIFGPNNWTDYKELLSDFFDSLPGAVYVNQKDSTKNLICLSNYFKEYELTSDYFERFFAQDVDSIDYISTSKKSGARDYNVVAIIRSSQEINTMLGSHGLTLSEPFEGAAVWNVFSSPSQVYQHYFNIYNDAFVQLTMGESNKQATLKLFYQDIRNKQGFNVSEARNITTGETAYRASKKASYFIGSTMPLTKGLPYMGQDVKASMFNMINSCNKHNLLNDHFIQCTILEDEYAPNLALQNIRNLISKYNTNTILLPVGSPTLEAYFNLVEKKEISVLFPVTGNPAFRRADLKNIIHWRASYHDEARVLVEYMLTENAVKRFAFFYQNDSYGKGPLEAAHELLKAKGITNWIDIPYNKTGVNYDEAVAIIRKEQPDAIGLFSIPSVTKEFIRRLGIELLFNKKLFGISFISDDSFIKTIKELGIKVLFSQVVPNPRTNNLEIVKEFREFMDKINHPYNIYCLESYICTSLYLEALKSFKGVGTTEQIIEYFESFKNFSYKGLTMNFNPKTRDLGQSVWLELNENTWKEYRIASESRPTMQPNI